MTEPLSWDEMSGAGDPHVFPIRVYFEDTDAGGIVYYANYLKFAERARTEMMRSLGVESSHWLDGEGVVFAVRRCDADYRRPARLDDLLQMHTWVCKIGGASFQLEQRVTRGGEDLVRMDITLVCMDATGRAVRIPGGVRERLESHCKGRLRVTEYGK